RRWSGGRAARKGNVLEDRERTERRWDRQDEVDVEAPAPGQVLRERAAEEKPDGGAAAGDGAEDAERLAPLPGLRERRRQCRQGSRSEQRAEDALEHARGEEPVEALGRAAERRDSREADGTDDEGALATEHVTEATAERQQAAEGKRVAGDDPLTLAVREVQRALRRGQGDVHDRRVEHD